MSLITYEDTRPWARSIKQRTGLRHTQDAMPPWYIEKDIGIQDYKGDTSLSDAEVAAIATWVDNGAPRGNPADAPPLLEFPDASVWTIGQPDLIVSSPSVEIGAADPDWWGPIGQVAVEGLTEDRYVAAIEMKEINNVEPSGGRDTVGSRWGIHHLVWNVIHPEEYTVEELAELCAEPTLTSMRRGRELDHQRAGLLAGARGGAQRRLLRSEGRRAAARRVEHRLLVGAPALDGDAHDVAPRHRLQVPSARLRAGVPQPAAGLRHRRARHPRRQANQKIETFQTLSYNAKLTIFEPHLHAAGTRMCLDAIYPTTGRWRR